MSWGKGADAVLERYEALIYLRKQWVNGVPIVPLFGNGVSVDASIPTGTQITEYLAKVYYLTQLEGETDPSEYLLAHGWPSRHQLNVDLLVRHRSAQRELPPEQQVTLTQAVEDAVQKALPDIIATELTPNHPTAAHFFGQLADVRRAQLAHDARELAAKIPDGTTPQVAKTNLDWIPLLQFLSGRSQSLIDACFARIVRGRTPATAHQFIAFLTKVLNWNPILTTNFDDLIESALRAEGLTPTVYELTRDGAPPHPQLVQSQLSIIKLHGGAYGLRAGHDLNEPLDPGTTAIFQDYLPRKAVLLVVGYGGGDRRVRGLIDAWISGNPGEREVMWVQRSTPPKLPKRVMANVKRLSADDAGMFLHELHQRLLYSHPVGIQPYSAIYHPAGATYPKLKESTLPVYPPASKEHWRLRAELQREQKEHLDRWKSTQKLWIDLHELTSFSAFLSMFLEQLQKYDRGLPPVIRVPVFVHDGHNVSREALAPYRHLVRYALCRQNYFIAIDATHAFSRYAASGVTDSNAVGHSRQLLYTFLRDLVTEESPHQREWRVVNSSKPNLGESKIAIAVAPEDERAATLSGLHGDGLFVVPPAEAKSEPPPATEPEAMAQHYLGLYQKQPIKVHLLKVAAAFRRPRSLVGLVRTTARSLPPECHAQRRNDRVDRVVGTHIELFEEVERAIEELVADGLLERHEGGFFSMTSSLRTALNDWYAAEVREPEQAVFERHDKIADYYRAELYEHSGDIAAYFEYMFHRIQSSGGKDRSDRMKWLIGSLERERLYLISRGRGVALLDSSRHARSSLSTDGKDEQIASLLSQVEAEVLGDLMEYQACRRWHEEQIRRELTHVGSGDAASPAEIARRFAVHDDTLASLMRARTAAEHMLEIGACTSAMDRYGSQSSDAAEWLQAARDLVDSVRDNIGDTSSLQDIAGLIELRSLERQMAHALRDIDPWCGAPAATSQAADAIESMYVDSVDRFRYLSHGPRVRQLQCRMRCNRARALYLDGQFEKANIELNRAHAFGARGAEPDGHATLARYYLHRAEYCILRARSAESGDKEEQPESRRQWLLEAARTALRDGEGYLRRGRRDVASWCWLFLLRGWQTFYEIDDIMRGAAAEGQSLQNRRPPRAVSIRASRVEPLFLSGLHAVAAGLVNISNDQQLNVSFAAVWDGLRLLWSQTGGSHERDQTAQEWELLNHRAGLGWYWAERVRRFAPAGIKVDGKHCVRDMNELGFVAERADHKIGRDVTIKIAKDNGGAPVEAVVRCIRHQDGGLSAYEVLQLSAEARWKLRQLLENEQERKHEKRVTA